MKSISDTIAILKDENIDKPAFPVGRFKKDTERLSSAYAAVCVERSQLRKIREKGALQAAQTVTGFLFKKGVLNVSGASALIAASATAGDVLAALTKPERR